MCGRTKLGKERESSVGFFDSSTGKYINTEVDENYYDDTGAGSHVFHPDLYAETETERARRLYGEMMLQRDTFRDPSSRPITPQISIVNISTKLIHNNERSEVWGYIRNDSSITLQLVKIVWLGTVVELRRDLRPHESHLTKLYDGKTPDNDSSKKAQLMFRRNENTELYLRDYLIEYSVHNDGHYIVSALKAVSRTQNSE